MSDPDAVIGGPGSDLLRQHGHQTPADVRLAVFETRGVVSILDDADRSG